MKNMLNNYLKKFSVALLPLIFMTACRTENPNTPYTPDTTNSSRQTVSDLNINGSGLYALLLSPTSDQLNVLDLTDNRVKLSVGTGRNPTTLALSTKKDYIIVLNSTDETVSSYYRVDNQHISVLGTIGINGNPTDVIFNNSGTEAYVPSEDQGRLTVLTILNRNRPKVQKVIQIKTDNTFSPAPYKVAVSADDNNLYAIDKSSNRLFIFKKTNNDWAQTDTVMLTDSTQKSVLEDIIFNNGKLYISDSSNGSIIVFDTATNKTLATVSLTNTDVTTNPLPARMVVNPSTNKLYVANQGSATVAVVDLSNNTLIKHIHLATGSITDSSSPTGLSINGSGDTMYVTNNVGRNLSIISTKTDTLSRNIGTDDSSSSLDPLSDVKML